MLNATCCLNSAISLRQSCRTLLNTLPTPLHPRSYTVDECFERLCMDDEYKKRQRGRAVCGVCKMCHATSNFSLQQLECKPVERVCKGAERLLSVTPNTHWSYRELLQRVDGPIVHLSPNPPDDGLSCVLKRVRGYWIIATEWSINLLDDFTVQPPVLICPHMHATHPRIRQTVDRLREEARVELRLGWRNELSSQSRAECVTCDVCGWADCVEICWVGGDWGKIHFHSRRLLGCLKRPGCEKIWLWESRVPFGDGA